MKKAINAWIRWNIILQLNSYRKIKVEKNQIYEIIEINSKIFMQQQPLSNQEEIISKTRIVKNKRNKKRKINGKIDKMCSWMCAEIFLAMNKW